MSPFGLDPPVHELSLFHRRVDVLDRPADITDEVKMPFAVGLVDIEGTSKAQTVGEALLNEDVEVAVYVAKTERRELVPKLIVHPVGGYMNVIGLQQLQNTIALFTLPQLCCHGYNIVSGAISVNES